MYIKTVLTTGKENSFWVYSSSELLVFGTPQKMKYKNLKNRNNKSKFNEIFSEYLCRSQVQGYKLIVQTDRPLFERILWILITIFGIILTFWFVINSYFDFLDSPTVTSEDPIRTSVLELSFPAVSICNSNRISRRALIKYSKFMCVTIKQWSWLIYCCNFVHFTVWMLQEIKIKMLVDLLTKFLIT